MAKLLLRPSLIDVFCQCQVSSVAYCKVWVCMQREHFSEFPSADIID